MPDIPIGPALSIRQPWAALLVHGIKTIEIRSWPTSRKGRILIHAARVPDRSDHAWSHVTPEAMPTTQQMGGIIGTGELIDCIAYKTADSFAADRHRHLNDPDWFRTPALYGFQFEQLELASFRPYPGWVRFFPVHAEPPKRKSRSKGRV